MFYIGNAELGDADDDRDDHAHGTGTRVCTRAGPAMKAEDEHPQYARLRLQEKTDAPLELNG